MADHIPQPEHKLEVELEEKAKSKPIHESSPELVLGSTSISASQQRQETEPDVVFEKVELPLLDSIPPGSQILGEIYLSDSSDDEAMKKFAKRKRQKDKLLKMEKKTKPRPRSKPKSRRVPAKPIKPTKKRVILRDDNSDE